MKNIRLKKQESNLAFIDGQNLHLGIAQNGGSIDNRKFRTYLQEAYGVQEAYYFLGYACAALQGLYDDLQKAGFIVLFREQGASLQANKKGNVDTDIVFGIMRALSERHDFHQVLLVSGDGDYKKLVDYLAVKGRLKKLLFPNKRSASSLYKNLTPAKFDYLDGAAVQKKIACGGRQKSS